MALMFTNPKDMFFSEKSKAVYMYPDQTHLGEDSDMELIFFLSIFFACLST